MSNRVYWVNGTWTSRKREAERIYNSFEHARMEVWDNKMDHNSARFIKKK